MVTDKQVEAAWAVIRSCGKPVGAGDGSTYVPRMPNADDIRRALEAAEAVAWKPIESAPKDGTDFLSVSENNKDKPHETRFLSPGPYTTENGKNTQGERRYQWPDGFYWSGYDGFVGPVEPTHWRHLPQPPKETT